MWVAVITAAATNTNNSIVVEVHKILFLNHYNDTMICFRDMHERSFLLYYEYCLMINASKYMYIGIHGSLVA